MPKCYLLTLLLINCMCRSVLAQDTTRAKPGFKLFFEKTYLHTDREHYAAGEDIWFKAYLVNGQSNELFNSSNNLYVELISPQSAVIDRKIIRLDNGLGNGDFKLSDSVQAGTYRIRAYTNWMLNFGDNFIFEKELHIYNDINAARRPSVAGALKPQSDNTRPYPSPSQVNSSASVTSSLRFFPEGGSIIEEAINLIAFKAEDANGKGIQVKGAIYSSAGDQITDFESNAYGLGSFLLLPVPGTKYEARGTYSNKLTFTVPLPGALLKGFALNTQYTDSVINVIVNTNALTLKEMQDKNLTLIGKSKGKTMFTLAVPLKALQTLITVHKTILPQGITAITLFDNDGKPQCEQLIYNEKAENAKLIITPDRTAYSPKGKVTLQLKTTDHNGAPVKAHLSLAVVDAGLITQNQGNILSYLYLQSEIRGTIENPGQYFDAHNTQRQQQLNLLLLTQGWRDFVWKHLADSAIRISYALEQGIAIAGRVRQIWADKPLPGLNISLFANGAKNSKLFATQTDAKGNYLFEGINLWGNQEINVSAANNKGKPAGYILVDTTGKRSYPVKPFRTWIDSAYLLKFTNDMLKRKVIVQKTKFSDTTRLKEVNITSLVAKKIKIDTVIKMTRDDYKQETLYDYILAKIPGAQSAYPRRIFFYGLNKDFAIVPRRTIFTADSLPEWRAHWVNFYDIPLDRIIEIRFRKVWITQIPTMTQTREGFDLGDNFWLNLKLKPHAIDDVDFHSVHFDKDGYYQARSFYTPKYDTPVTHADYRTTIHWEPNITTEQGETTITYYNADPRTPVRIVAEGITDNGVPLSGTVSYDVK